MNVIRTAQLFLVLAALLLWGASKLPWVQVATEDGLGPRKVTTLDGSHWSTALIPLALLAAAAAVAALAVRGWPLRLLALLMAVSTAAMGYLGISLWVATDISVRAADMAHVPVMFLVGVTRHHWGAGVTLAAAVCTLAGAVLLMRAAGAKSVDKYRAAGRVNTADQGEESPGMSERMIWDALDEGHDPTQSEPGDRS